jgi:hypothetical protein
VLKQFQLVQYVIRTIPDTSESELVLAARPLGSLVLAGDRYMLFDRTSTVNSVENAEETLRSHKSLSITALATAAAEERRVVRSIDVVDELGSIYKNDVAMRKCLEIMCASFGSVDVLLVVEASRLMRVQEDLPKIFKFIQAAHNANVPVFTLLPAGYFNANCIVIDGERCVRLSQFKVSEATCEGPAFTSAAHHVARRLADSLVTNAGVIKSHVIYLLRCVIAALLSVAPSRLGFVAVCARVSPSGAIGRALNAGLSQVTCVANLCFGGDAQHNLLLRVFAGKDGISVSDDYDTYPLVQLLKEVGATEDDPLDVCYRSLERISRSEYVIRRLCAERRARIVAALMPRTLFAALVKEFNNNHELVAAILPRLPPLARERATLIAYVSALRRIVDNGGIYGLNPCLVLPYQLTEHIVGPLCAYTKETSASFLFMFPVVEGLRGMHGSQSLEQMLATEHAALDPNEQRFFDPAHIKLTYTQKTIGFHNADSPAGECRNAGCNVHAGARAAHCSLGDADVASLELRGDRVLNVHRCADCNGVRDVIPCEWPGCTAEMSSGHRRRHVREVHHGVKFQCEICGEKLTKKFNLQRHIKRRHAADVLAQQAEVEAEEQVEEQAEEDEEVEVPAVVHGKRAFESISE